MVTTYLSNFRKFECLDDITDHGKYPDADPNKPIRIYSFLQDEAEEFENVIHYGVVTRKQSLDLATLLYIERINCTFKFEVATIDFGIEPSSENSFIFQLSIESYRQMIGFMRTFCGDHNKMNGHN